MVSNARELNEIEWNPRSFRVKLFTLTYADIWSGMRFRAHTKVGSAETTR